MLKTTQKVAQAVDIKIQGQSGNPVKIEIRQTTTVFDLKSSLEPILNATFKNQILKFGGRELVDTEKLMSIGVSDDSIIDFEEKQQQFFVKDISGKSHVHKMRASEKVYALKQQINQYAHIDPKEQRLILGNKQIKDEDTLYSSGLTGECTVMLVLRMEGGSFIDASGVMSMQTIDFSDDAPAYRNVKRGLSIEGRCKNQLCPASGHMCICSFGFEEFNLLTSKAKCPLCKQDIDPVKPGFSNCFFNIQAVKTNGEKLWTHWLESRDKYQTYDESKVGSINYRELKAMAMKKDDVIGGNLTCSICLIELMRTDPETDQRTVPDEIRILDCQHAFHKSCITQWTSNHNICPNCRKPVNTDANAEEAQILQNPVGRLVHCDE
ncbi:MAG: putative Ubiquitin family protein [Streblomastix strix]|uniref:Putative Ubiquitin family protein n=1 Tax=Streblomastix strix TaxID=222440 RepID=A0A5J4WXL9_9EUKA|nr:MAG: putative Ubiquitin family protein [Streblomastix strix]